MRRNPTAAGRALAPAAAIVLLSLLSTGAAWAQSPGGPWVQTKNGYYATGRLAWGSETSFYDANGKLVTPSPEEKIQSRQIDFVTEYGISHRLTLHLAMPVEFLKFDVPAANFHATNNGFGDLLFGFKYGFLDPAGKSAVALEVDANTPTGYNAQGFGVPSLGRGKFSVDGHLRAGITLDPTPAYGWVEVGYRKFTDSDVSPALVYGAEAGVFASPRVLLLGHLDAEKARDDTKAQFLSYTRVEGLVQYGLKPHFDVMAGYRRTLSGKETDKTSELRLGVALKGNGIGHYRGQSAAGGAATHTAKLSPAPPAAPATPAPPVPSAAPAPVPAPSDTTKTPEQPK